MKIKNIFLALAALLMQVTTYKKPECIECHKTQTTLKQNYKPTIKKLIYNGTIDTTEIENLLDEIMPSKVIENVYEVYDINYYLRYYLVTFEDLGYLIYDIQEKDFEEYSEANDSPYKNVLSSTKIYIGVGKYYYVDNGSVKNVRTGAVVDSVDEQNLQEIYTDLRERKEECVEQGKTQSRASNIPATYNAPYAYYFSNLHRNYAYNINGTCAYIAYEIILAYFNICGGQSGLIPEQYLAKEPVTSSFSEDWTQSPGTIYGFHQDILDLAVENNYTAGLTVNQLKTFMGLYKTTFAPNYSYSTTIIDVSATNMFVTLEMLIALSMTDGKILVVGIDGYDEAVGEDLGTTNHAVVAYGYVQSGKGLRIHFGDYYGDITDVIIRDYNINQGLGIEYTGTHQHSQCYYNEQEDVITHICPCGEHFYHYHDWDYEILSRTKHRKTCSECGIIYEQDHTLTGLQLQVCECGYTETPLDVNEEENSEVM